MQSYVLPEAHDPEESWTDEERAALAANLDEAYQQAVRGELIDGEQAFREIELMKEAWRKSKRKGFLRQPHQSAPPLV